MSEQSKPGLHPDPDSLNAFVEGALPRHERQQCLAHLAECPQCRAVVFLAAEPSPVATHEPVPVWRRWLAPIPAFAAAAALSLSVIGGWLYLRHPAERQAPQLVAEARGPAAHVPEAQAPPPLVRQSQPPASKPEASAPRLATIEPPQAPVPSRPLRNYPPQVGVAISANPAPPVPLPDAPAASGTVSALAKSSNGAAPPPDSAAPAQAPRMRPAAVNPAGLTLRAASVEAAAVSGVSITVTDASGGAVPKASVNLRQVDGAFTSAAQTDANGEVHTTGIPPGRYELQVGAPGFRDAKQEIELHPREMASVKTRLDVGSSSENVEVAAAAQTLQSDTASFGKKAAKQSMAKAPLASTGAAPEELTVRSGKIVVKMDSAGTVFFSKNAGKSWDPVKPVWSGKVRAIELAEPSENPNSTFRLTTEAGAVWLSRDGKRWILQKN